MSWTRGLAPPRRSPLMRRHRDNALEKSDALRPGRFCAPGTRSSSSRRRCPSVNGAPTASAQTIATRLRNDRSYNLVRRRPMMDGEMGIARTKNRTGLMALMKPAPTRADEIATAPMSGIMYTGRVRRRGGGATSKSARPFDPFAFRESGFPIMFVRGFRSESLGWHLPCLSARFYSDSSRSDKSNDSSNIRSGTNNKANPIVADGDEPKSQNNLQSKNDTSLETPPDDAERKPSEPSVHNVSYLPPTLRPYAHLARMDKPIGTMLLLHPCLWSTALASAPLGSLPDPKLCALFGMGSFVMRGAGCTVNDMWDARYDRNVARTRSRPLASGELTYPQAWRFLALQLTAGLGVLVSLPHLETCFWWGAASLPLVATYPLAKRWTAYPQLMLGLTFNWGAIVGWVAVRGEVDWSAVGPLYGGCVAWTLVYDTLYAHQDKEDDAKLGLKSTALTFGEERTRPILTVLTAAAWGGWCLAGYNCGFGSPLELPYYYAGVTGAGAHLLWQIWTAELDDAENLAARFRSNNVVGWIVCGSCVAGNMMAG